MSAPNISHLVIMGDSLSDDATLYHRTWLSVPVMRYLSGLQGHSPKGRFTNGYVWSDAFSAALIDEFIINDLERKKKNSSLLDYDIIDGFNDDPINQKQSLSDSDIADGIIDQDPNIDPQIHDAYSLRDYKQVKYRGKEFVRNYAEGGLTSHDYSWWPSYSITRFFSRLILATLGHKREELLNDDRNNHTTKKRKAETLVIEWSGANDLITVNAHPSIAEADRAVKDRINNVEKLIKNGYQHFVLFNLPDLSLTPRYKNKDKGEQDNAHLVTEHFNKKLADACKELKEKYPYFTIDVFDINSEFTKIYKEREKSKNPEELKKLTTPYLKSPDFEIDLKKGTSPAKGYMFWDDVHPTAEIHELLAVKFREELRSKYNFGAPKVESEQAPVLEISATKLCALFLKHYKAKLAKDRNSFFNCFRHSNLSIDFEKTNPEVALKQIMRHALYEGGNRTRDVIKSLRWIDKEGHLNLNIPALHRAIDSLNEEISLEKRSTMLSKN